MPITMPTSSEDCFCPVFSAIYDHSMNYPRLKKISANSMYGANILAKSSYFCLSSEIFGIFYALFSQLKLMYFAVVHCEW